MTKRMSAVEAATARLEAAKKRERVGLLKKACAKLGDARLLLQAAGDIEFPGDEHEESAVAALIAIHEAIRAEVGE